MLREKRHCNFHHIKILTAEIRKTEWINQTYDFIGKYEDRNMQSIIDSKSANINW